MSMNWIKSIVNGITEMYHTRNIYELINSLNITLIRKDFKNSKKARFFRNSFGDEFIFLDSKLSESEERYVLAHELGHAILHTNLSCEYFYFSKLNYDKVEFQANLFATELLIADNDLDTEFIKDKTLNQLSKYFGVPEQMIEYKFKTIK